MTQSDALVRATTDAFCFVLDRCPADVIVEQIRQVLEFCDGSLAVDPALRGELPRQINAVTAQRLETGRWRGAQ